MNVIIKSAGKKGRGVFAARNLKKGECIEICPVIVIPARQWPSLSKTNIANYVYAWNKRCAALALGTGSLYNHSVDPNSRSSVEEKKNRIVYYTLRPIKKGE